MDVLTQKKVSVIIPVYNTEDFLQECIDSVISQTLNDIEIICVDDGSTDRSPELLRDYSQRDSRIKIITKPNGGLSAARNCGILEASGKYIYFLDSDDYILPETLEKLYACAEENALDSISFGGESFYENEQLMQENIGYRDYYYRSTALNQVLTGAEMLTAFIDEKKFRSSVPMQFFRLGLLREHNILFYEGITHEDELFTPIAMMHMERTMCVPERFYMRRVRQGSIMTANASKRRFNGQFSVYALLLAESIIRGDGGGVLGIRAHSVLSGSRQTFDKLSPEDQQDALNALPASFRALHTELYSKYARLSELENQSPSIKRLISALHLPSSEKDMLREIERQRALVAQLRGELNSVCSSTSFKVGRVLTFIPRKLRGAIRYMNQFGLRSTCIHALETLGFKWLVDILRRKKRERYVRNVLARMGEVAVSVIVPVYNVDKYLRQCLDSILGQTLKNIELICVDDGSTDSSLNILEEYAARDSRVKIIRQQNQFAGVARNNGMKIAQGKYLLFLDSDDFFEPNMMEEMCVAAEETNAQITLCASDQYQDDTGEFMPMSWTLNQSRMPNKRPFSSRDCANLIFQITSPAPWNKLFLREFVEQTGLRFQALPRSNDLYFVLSALSMAERINAIGNVLVHYRVSRDGSLQSNNAKSPTTFIEAIAGLKDTLVRNDAEPEMMESFADLALNTSVNVMQKLERAPEALNIALTALKEHAEDFGFMNGDNRYTTPRNREYLLKKFKSQSENTNT